MQFGPFFPIEMQYERAAAFVCADRENIRGRSSTDRKKCARQLTREQLPRGFRRLRRWVVMTSEQKLRSNDEKNGKHSH